MQFSNAGMKLSVIIVNYNVCFFLEQCLYSVERACEGIESEIFVVDNQSTDGSVAMVREKFPHIRLIANEINTGFSFANNQAIKESKGEYVLLLNPDTVVEEETFVRIIDFMDRQKDGGGLGVKMIDGTGKFLPESKRGLPTPEVAFYKIFGLSLLFPFHKRFGKYHLGYLDSEHVHEIEILSGAFMFMRRSVLDQVGLLDEHFFMYGEDIDLSYRITQAGFKNYYYPHTRIIHYKGESTKKSSINYVFVFYRAMVIFARKHFSRQYADTFSFFINMAIYLRAALAIASRFIQRLLLPVADFLLVTLAAFVSSGVLSTIIPETPEVSSLIQSRPLPFVLWVLSGLSVLMFAGAYDKPVYPRRVWSSMIPAILVMLSISPFVLGAGLHSVFYSLISGILAGLMLGFLRLLLGWMKISGFQPREKTGNRFIIVGDRSECIRVSRLLEKTSNNPSFVGFVSADEQADPHYFIGQIGQIEKLIRRYGIDELIFCSKNLNSQRIINLMEGLSRFGIDFKIAPARSSFVIGSNSIESSGELYLIDMNAINRPSNRRIKRMLDVAVGLALLIASPVLAFRVQRPGDFFLNLLAVLSGRKSWVGYAKQLVPTGYMQMPLPKIRQGILNPADGQYGKNISPQLVNKLNLLYSKDYSLSYDWNLIRKGLGNLGRRS